MCMARAMIAAWLCLLPSEVLMPRIIPAGTLNRSLGKMCIRDRPCPYRAGTAGGDRGMKVYQGHSASPGLVMGKVSRWERWHENFATGPFDAEREQRLLENAVRTAQRELDGMADRSGRCV